MFPVECVGQAVAQALPRLAFTGAAGAQVAAVVARVADVVRRHPDAAAYHPAPIL
jgi:adenylosuccinate lyase